MTKLKLLKDIIANKKRYPAGKVITELNKKKAEQMIAQGMAEAYAHGSESEPDYFKMLVDETGKKIVKEREARHTILLIALGGTFTNNANHTSTNLCVNDDSGTGKDYVTSNCLKMLKNLENVEMCNRSSPNVYTYLHQNEEGWTWDGQVQYLEDVSSTILNCDAFKTFSSGGSHSQIVVNQKTVKINVKGKPVMILTTASADPDTELLRRYPMVSLDSGKDQTRDIMKQQALAAAKCINLDYDSELMESLLLLDRVEVIVPFAQRVEPRLNADHTIMRTHFPRFLDYIKFSASIHQFSRKKDSEGRVMAEGLDYNIGRTALIAITSNALSIPLTKTRKKVLETFKPDMTYSAMEILARAQGVSSSKTIYKHLEELTKTGFIKSEVSKQEGEREKTVYSLIPLPKMKEIPTWEEIENAKDKILQD